MIIRKKLKMQKFSHQEIYLDIFIYMPPLTRTHRQKASEQYHLLYILLLLLLHFSFSLLLLMIIKMAEEAKQKFLNMALQKINPNEEKEDPSRVAMDGDDDDDACEYESTSVESSMEDSANSAASFSSIDLLEDASSSSSSSSSASLISHANGPLYELSELMTHLPIK